MNCTQAELYLAILYIGSTVLSIISTVSLVVSWQHWVWTLDVCIDVNCGCILYGIKTFNTFMGGDIKICHFTSYGLVPITLFGLCFGCYHGYRRCFSTDLDEPRIAAGARYRSSNTPSYNGQVVVVTPKRRKPFKQWMLAAFCAVLLSCLSLAHAVVMTDGFYKTCDQYRKNLRQLLGSSGREIQVIYNRLPCGSIFDFMDYLQPDANNWRRGDEINTGFALQLAIFCSWLNFFAWLLSGLINFIMARKRLNSLGEKLCCCCC
ncbi:uncharacterized protein [Prorops nasuta]|uniref:uncharacterized protein n=1 Tax=Prorops nasuta TaxID=863751 RepID=UPI0034CDE02E